METIKLTDRLALIASLVPQGSAVADVGTDHGYIPVLLAQTGGAQRITASDVRRGPLSAARQSAQKYGVADKIEFILCDGLEGIAHDTETIIIAGMGGETIAGIIERARWVHDSGALLILQPQTKLCQLANSLDNEGYAISDAALVRDAGHIYTVLTARAGASRAPFTCAEMYADRILMEKRDPLLPEYLDVLIERMSRVVRGMESARDARIDELDHARFALRGFYKMREETEKWRL